jgi:hypothetical protein
MRIFREGWNRCFPVPEQPSRKEAVAAIDAQIQAVSTMINGLRERMVELTTQCNSRIGDCAARVIDVEKRLNKITGPLESKSNDELHRVFYILELIKKDQDRKRKRVTR